MENGPNKEVINFMWIGRMELWLPAFTSGKCALTLHSSISVTDRVVNSYHSWTTVSTALNCLFPMNQWFWQP